MGRSRQGPGRGGPGHRRLTAGRMAEREALELTVWQGEVAHHL